MSPDLARLLLRWRAVNDAIDSLPPQRRTVLLHRLSGLSIAETAKLVKVSRERVRQIQDRAFEDLGCMLFDPPSGTPIAPSPGAPGGVSGDDECGRANPPG